MVAEKGNEKSGTALAALVQALHNKQSVALILFLPRVSATTGGNPAICAGTPVLVSLCFVEQAATQSFLADHV